MQMLSREALRDKVNAVVEEYLALSGRQSLSVGLYFGGVCYGLSLNPTESDRFYSIGSVSKTVTAQLILWLAEQGKLDIHSCVSRYLPLKPGEYPTIYNLLTHTAGYGHLTPVEVTVPKLLRHRYSHRNPYEAVTAEAVCRCLERRKFRGERAYGYSDFSYAVLAVVAEKVTNRPFSRLFADFIRNELGLKQTAVAFAEQLAPAVYRGKEIPGWRWEGENPYLAGGGVVSNLEDMLRYLQMQIESDGSFVRRGQEICPVSFSRRKGVGTATAWHTYPKSHQMWHVGGVGTYRCSVIFNRKREIGVVVMGNSSGVRRANVHYLAKMLYSELKLKKVKRR